MMGSREENIKTHKHREHEALHMDIKGRNEQGQKGSVNKQGKRRGD